MTNKKRPRVHSKAKKQSNTNVGNTNADSCVESFKARQDTSAPAVITLELLENKVHENRYSVACAKKRKCKSKRSVSSDIVGRINAAVVDQCSLSAVGKPNVKLKPVAKYVKTAEKNLKSECSNRTANSTSASVASNSVREALLMDNNVPGKRRKRRRHSAEVDSAVKVKTRRPVDSKSVAVCAAVNECSVGPTKCNFNIVQLQSALQQCGRFSDAVSKHDRLHDEVALKNRTHQLAQEAVTASAEHEEIDDGNNSLPSKMASVGCSSGSLKDRMMNRLASARFRFINEQMYRSTGSEAAEMFAHDKDAFTVYHAGFQSQVSKWPTNPVDRMIDYINSR